MTDTPQVAAKRSKKPFVFGCLGGGCLSVIIVVVGFTWYWASWAKSLPEDNPSVDPTPFNQEAFDDLTGRYESFRRAVETGESEQFVLTEDDINVALSKWAAEDKKAARAVIELEGVTASGKASIPVPDKKTGAQKWINCEFIVGVAVKDGELELEIKELKLKDKTFTEEGIMAKPMKQLKQDYLAKLKAEPKFQREMEKVESVEIKDGQVIIRIKPGSKLQPLKLRK